MRRSTGPKPQPLARQALPSQSHKLAGCNLPAMLAKQVPQVPQVPQKLRPAAKHQANLRKAAKKAAADVAETAGAAAVAAKKCVQKTVPKLSVPRLSVPMAAQLRRSC